MYSQQKFLSNGPPPRIHSHSLGAFLKHFQFARHRYIYNFYESSLLVASLADIDLLGVLFGENSTASEHITC